MADCFAAEADDLHRRWLPPEIFADIGIADLDAKAAPAEAPSAAAAGAGVGELAAQLADIIGAGSKQAAPRAAPRAPPPPPPAPCQRNAQVCGLERGVVVAYGGINGVGGGAAAAAWPFALHPHVPWQMASGVVDYPRPPHPAACCRLPPPASPRGGTGVFLPRAQPYRHASSPPPKDAKATRASWASWPAGTTREEAAGAARAQQPWHKGTAAPATHQQQHHHPQALQLQQPQAKAAAVAALPPDWTYHH